MQRVGFVALIILTLLLCIVGYYDFIQWFSSIVGVVLCIYFVLLRVAVKKNNIAV